MIFNTIPLVNWGMGSVLIGVFALVCIVMAVVIYNMANSNNKKDSEN